MAPRMKTVTNDVASALALIDQGKVKQAATKLRALDAKLTKKAGSPKKPNAYALFVKANYKKYAAENPTAEPVKIMSMIAAAWKTQKS